MLNLRGALAQEVQAQLSALVGTIQLYTAAVEESVGLAALLPGVPTSQRTMDGSIARTVLRALRPALPSEFRFGTESAQPPLVESEAAVTQAARAAVERVAQAGAVG